MTPDFEIDSRLAAEGTTLGELPLCRVLLRNEARFPWMVLVPRRARVAELFELSPEDRLLLMEEISRTGAALSATAAADKINVALFGNIVRQLHVHVVARFEGDPAWPGSAVGFGAPEPYAPGAADALARRLKTALGLA